MAKTLSANLQTEVGAPVTTPAFLVEIGFSTVLRLSTRGDQTWNGQTWAGGRLGKVQAGSDGGQIEVMNTDLAAGALVLGEGVADRPISVWKFYGDNPAVGDAHQVFAGVGDTVDIGDDRIRIKLALENSQTLSSPRRFVNAASGFTQLLPANTRLTLGGQTFILNRGG